MVRNKFFGIITLTLCLCSIASFSAEKAAPVKVACVGDSITFGAKIKDRTTNSYPAQLNELLGDQYTVKNFGNSGSTLLKNGNKPYWKQKAYTDALAFNPDIVIIKLGTNDSKPENWAHKAEYIPDYVELIETFQALESNPTIWICYPVPAYPGKWA
ncbi:GDSL-type esterase/lipase family protein [Pontiellaceae bacterium B12219]|nr:GDSL-type esterase/lipase family protein [Pontiellaceae bacterium B12219]